MWAVPLVGGIPMPQRMWAKVSLGLPGAEGIVIRKHEQLAVLEKFQDEHGVWCASVETWERTRYTVAHCHLRPPIPTKDEGPPPYAGPPLKLKEKGNVSNG
jgi:hypothetical protein